MTMTISNPYSCKVTSSGGSSTTSGKGTCPHPEVQVTVQRGLSMRTKACSNIDYRRVGCFSILWMGAIHGHMEIYLQQSHFEYEI